MKKRHPTLAEIHAALAFHAGETERAGKTARDLVAKALEPGEFEHLEPGTMMPVGAVMEIPEGPIEKATDYGDVLRALLHALERFNSGPKSDESKVTARSQFRDAVHKLLRDLDILEAKRILGRLDCGQKPTGADLEHLRRVVE